MTCIFIPHRVKLFLLLTAITLLIGLLLAFNFAGGDIIFTLNSTHISYFDYFFTALNYWPEPITIICIAIIYGILKPYRVLVLLFNLILIIPITFGLKHFLNKSRPIQEIGVKLATVLSRDVSFFVADNMSLPSGHATSAFALALFCLYDPKCKHWILTMGLFTLAFSAAVSRIYLGHHYLIDVIAGAAVGTFLSFIITAFAEQELPHEVRNWRWNFSH